MKIVVHLLLLAPQSDSQAHIIQGCW